MELREMRVFIGIAEAGSFSSAARELGVSQSALSQTISSLERRLEARLLIRTRTGVYPTETGRVLLAEAHAVIDRHDRALTTLARKIGGDEETLRVGLPLDLPPGLFGKPFAVLESAFSGTRVTVRHMPQAGRESALRAGALDVGLLYGRPGGDDLDCLLVLEEPLGVLLAARHAARLSGPDGVSLDALGGLEWVGFPRHDAPGFHDEVAAVLRNHGLFAAEPEPRSDSDSRLLIPEVRFAELAAGHGFGLAPPHAARQIPDFLTWCPLVGRPVVRRTWVAWPASCQRRDVGHFIAAFDVPERADGWPEAASQPQPAATAATAANAIR